MAREVVVRTIAQPWNASHQSFVSTELSINIATLIRVNLYALPGPISFRMAHASVSILMAGIRGVWHGPLRISPDVVRSPAYLRNAVAEMVGLGVAIELARPYGWDGRGPQCLDNLRQYWGEKGSRPDLVFDYSGSGLQFVAEAKGRIVDQAKVPSSMPNSRERKYLEKLSSWYDLLHLKYFLSVSWITTNGVTVDLFDPGEPQAMLPPESLDAAIRSREDHLLETAPQRGVMFDEYGELLGQWFQVPSAMGEETTRVFLGVIRGSGLSASVEYETDRVQVSGSGRVIVILHSGAVDEGELEVLDAVRLVRRTGDNDAYRIVLEGHGIAAGEPRPNGRFVVFAGSVAREPMGSFRGGDWATRDLLVEEGVIARRRSWDEYRFEENWVAPSPSAAARQVLGRVANGRKEWRTLDGQALGDQ